MAAPPLHTLHVGGRLAGWIDWLLAGAAIGALVNALPTIASGLTAIWMALRIYDWIERRWVGRSTHDID